MKILLTLTTLAFISISCQSHRPMHKYQGRKIASTPILKIFLREIAQKSKRYTARELEEQALNYIKRHKDDLAHGNWAQIGISDSQAKSITSLYDDLPHMPKVRKWITENITKIAKVRPSLAKEAYDLINKNNLMFHNPYSAKFLDKSIAGHRTSLFKSIDSKKVRVIDNIQEVGNVKISREYRSQLNDFSKRASKEPQVFVNGLESVESGAHISRKTGVSAYGPGCKKFNQKASFEVLETKANVDAYRANLISQLAEEKAKKSFKNYKDIPKDARLTKKEIDEATVTSFKKVLGYSDVEARAAVRRLKRKPCQVY